MSLDVRVYNLDEKRHRQQVKGTNWGRIHTQDELADIIAARPGQ